MYLDRIIDRKREQWANGGLPGAAEPRREPASRGRFRDALRREHVALIAEVKPRSPSKGDLWPAAQAVPLARTYAASGAAAVSVLAEEEFFGGSPALVAAIAGDAAVDVPVLYKDFVVDVRQVDLAHASGADGLLIIVRGLDDARLREVTGAARDCGLDPLHECFSEQDIDRALSVDADLIGVNNRDLQTFHVDLALGSRLRSSIPAGIVTVSESGLANAADVHAIARHGFDACLVGEALLSSGDVPSTVARMSGVPCPSIVP
jgi:indole-3-glycerol phosphate synthase